MSQGHSNDTGRGSAGLTLWWGRKTGNKYLEVIHTVFRGKKRGLLRPFLNSVPRPLPSSCRRARPRLPWDGLGSPPLCSPACPRSSSHRWGNLKAHSPLSPRTALPVGLGLGPEASRNRKDWPPQEKFVALRFLGSSWIQFSWGTWTEAWPPASTPQEGRSLPSLFPQRQSC